MSDVKLDSKGIAQILKSGEVAAAVHEMAESIAAAVRQSEPDAEEVVVDDYQTDRAASSVTIRDARGRLWQVRDGILTRAASSVGLEVTDR
jgi:hypothetical protein